MLLPSMSDYDDYPGTESSVRGPDRVQVRGPDLGPCQDLGQALCPARAPGQDLGQGRDRVPDPDRALCQAQGRDHV